MEHSRSELQRRMAEVDLGDADLEAVREVALDYISSNVVGASNVGRSFATNAKEDQEAFADWFTSMFERILRYREAVKEMDEEPNDDE